MYEAFLRTTDSTEDTLVETFQRSTDAKRLASDASKFGDAIAELLELVGSHGEKARKFHRLILV
ncbi:MAG TPA: hypothetical protein VKP30_19185 [Polyangiaceae bacterium]|nr:hypothetical protein [Polyangiaceae bacterium]